MSNVATLGQWFDDTGLVVNLTEEQENQAAAAIGQAKEMIDLFAGDVINSRCNRLGITLTGQLVNSGGLDQNPGVLILPLLKSMGYAPVTAAVVATIARTFPVKDRVSGLTYKHYQAVQGCDGANGKLTREQARQLLLDAQMGYQKKVNGEMVWVAPHPPSWVKKQRQALEGNAQAKIEQAAKTETNEVLNEVVPEVELAIQSTGVTSRKAASLTKKVETAIKKTVRKLEKEFSEAVDAEVEKQTAKSREAMGEYAKERKR